MCPPWLDSPPLITRPKPPTIWGITHYERMDDYIMIKGKLYAPIELFDNKFFSWKCLVHDQRRRIDQLLLKNRELRAQLNESRIIDQKSKMRY